MSEERIVETTDANGNVVERTIERETAPTSVTVNTGPKTGSGMGGILVALLLVAVAAVGFFLFTNSDSEARKDNAIADAAEDVGAAAEKAGAAVEKAADKIGN